MGNEAASGRSEGLPKWPTIPCVSDARCIKDELAAEPGAAHNQREGGLQPPVHGVHCVPYLHIYI